MYGTVDRNQHVLRMMDVWQPHFRLPDSEAGFIASHHFTTVTEGNLIKHAKTGECTREAAKKSSRRDIRV